MIYAISNNSKVYTCDEYEKVDFQNVINHLNNSDKHIEIDTETTGFEPLHSEVLCYQLGIGNDAYVIDNQSYPLKTIKSYLEDNSYTWYGQNLKFDLRFLLHNGIDISEMNLYDTMLAEVIIHTGLPDIGYSLDTIVWKYCQYHLDKSIRGDINKFGLSPKVIKYAAEDVMFLRKVAKQQMERIKFEDLESVLNLEMRVLPIFAEMEYYGLKLDRNLWLKAAEEGEKNIEKAKDVLDELVLNISELSKFRRKYVQLGLFGEIERKVDINYASPAQIKQLVNALGYNPPSTNAKELESINHPFIKQFLELKKLEKLRTTYGKNVLKNIRKDGTITTEFWQIVSTGRVSSGNKDKGYINLQNLPATDVYRNPFHVDDDEVLIDADFSGMEAVLAAEVSGEEMWILANNEGLDLHSINCELVFKDKWKDSAESDCEYYKSKKKCSCKIHKKMRDKIKTTTYLYLFGGGFNKLSKQLNISKDEAKTILSDFENSLPNLKNTVTLVRKFAKQNLYTRTMQPFKRRRYFLDYSKMPEDEANSYVASLERQSYNTVIQGSGADITKYAMVLIKKHLKSQNIPHKMRLQVHDAIMVSTKTEYGEQVKNIVISCMEEAGKKVCKKANLTADAYINKFWKK